MGIFITPEELKDTYYDAKKWTDDWIKPFDEYERLANNKLAKNLAPNMPRVNDGSLAVSLLETPMQVLPNMQSGKFKSTNKENPWINEIANIIWKSRIVPNANTQATFFDKEQMALYRALKYGAQPRYNFFVATEKYTGSDWSLPYIKNVKLEPGKYSIDDCDYVFLDVYYTKLQIKKIIESVKKENEKRKAEGEKADSTWNIEALRKLADAALSAKEFEEQNINERDKAVNASGIHTTILFNRGVGAPFYMFSKHLPDGEVIREWKNPDPTGDLPITMQYCYETLESPYGIGRVELAGATQNVLDYLTQAHVLATQLGLEPPIKIMGSPENTKMNSIIMAPRAKWILGNAQVETVSTTSSVYSQFPTNYGLYKAQLQNLQGRTDASVSSSSGNPEFSKTPAGIRFQQERTNAQDNYLRNKADTASARMATKMMNVHMAQMQGADILDIAEEDRERLEKAGYFDDKPETKIPSVNDIEIIYDEIRDTFQFEYDPRPEADETQKARWQELLDILTSNPNAIPMIEQSGYRVDLGEILKNIISNSGANGTDKVLIKVDPEKEAVIGAESPAQTDLTVERVMQEYGVDANTAEFMIAASQRGYSEEEIMQAIERKRQQDSESEVLGG